jgi:methyltransferase (TIGR00027 family)
VTLCEAGNKALGKVLGKRMTDSKIQNVSDTAFMVAVYRAKESERPDALFHDPLAGKLAGEHGKAIVAHLPRRAFFGQWLVSIRTHIIDDFIQTAIASGIDTILNLGAGLDTRPYRLDVPQSLQWIEVDYPHMIALKEERLAADRPHCRLDRISLDLADLDKRRQLLGEVATNSKNVLVLTEGVIPYLSVEAVASLADDLRAEPAFRYWIIDYFSPEARRYRKRMERKMQMENAPFLFDPPDYFGFLKAHRWQVKEMRYIPEEAEKLKRLPPLTFFLRLQVKLLRVFGLTRRGDAFRKSMAYLLLEPAN